MTHWLSQLLFDAPLQTNGSSSLDGNLKLDLVRNADPVAYTPITVVSAAGGVNGVFSTVENVVGEPSIGSDEGLAVTYTSATVIVTRALLGDANLDQQVDVLSDAFTLVANLGTTSGATWADGDFNGDSEVNVLGDAFILVSNLGRERSRLRQLSLLQFQILCFLALLSGLASRRRTMIA